MVVVCLGVGSRAGALARGLRLWSAYRLLVSHTPLARVVLALHQPKGTMAGKPGLATSSHPVGVAVKRWAARLRLGWMVDTSSPETSLLEILALLMGYLAAQAGMEVLQMDTPQASASQMDQEMGRPLPLQIPVAAGILCAGRVETELRLEALAQDTGLVVEAVQQTALPVVTALVERLKFWILEHKNGTIRTTIRP